jgi:cysteine desulfurase / selenocysteine lyase
MRSGYKQDFPRANQVAYCSDKRRGTPGRRSFHKIDAETIDLAANLLRTQSSNVAFLSCASEALHVLASSLEWKAGDEVLISESEFPSNVLPWLRLRQLGVYVIVVAVKRVGFDLAEVLQRISPRTRVVSLSLVSYKTGAYLPFVHELAMEAKRAGAILCVDATQALGRCLVPLEGVDYLMSSSFKWLLGPHGLGIVYMSPEFRRNFRPASVGWYSVSDVFRPDRFNNYELKPGAACISAGMPNFPSLYMLRNSLRFLLGAGVRAIFDDLQPLVAHLRNGLESLGCDLLTPANPRFTSGNVSFAHPDAEQIGAALERNGVIVWSGDGRVRASVHLYNDSSDVDRFLDVLSTELQARKSVHA